MKRLLALPLCLLVLAGCGGDDEEGSAPAPAQDTPAASGGGGGTASAVTIKDFEFEPGTATVKAGEELEWTNEDTANHNVIFDGDQPEDIDNLRQGQSGSVKFTEAGSFGYVCSYHPGMEGTVEVQ